jgi:glycerophosphoryl diester phosphodiesterase
VTKPLIIAHRGGAGPWPENTLLVFSAAARTGYDGAELDVQLTRDEKLAVFHDFRLKRRLAGGGRMSRPLCELDYCRLLAVKLGNERIPLLRDVIESVRSASKNFRLFIEIKTSFADRTLSAAPEAVAEAVVGELRGLDFFENAVLVGFDWPALMHAKKMAPELPCWFSTQGPGSRWARSARSWGAHFGRSLSEAIVQAGGDGWFCPRSRATPKAVQEARERGLKFGVWTVNDPKEMRALAALGVDAICTDRPDLLAALP